MVPSMTYSLLKLVHLLGLIVWIGGMAFSHLFMRPALGTLPAEQRLTFMHQVLQRFFNAVTVSAIFIFMTGVWMIARTAGQFAQAGIEFAMPVSWMFMAAVGMVMMAIFAWLRLLPYGRLHRAVTAQDWPAAGQALGTLRKGVAVNLVLGLIIIVVTMLG